MSNVIRNDETNPPADEANAADNFKQFLDQAMLAGERQGAFATVAEAPQTGQDGPIEYEPGAAPTGGLPGPTATPPPPVEGGEPKYTIDDLRDAADDAANTVINGAGDVINGVRDTIDNVQDAMSGDAVSDVNPYSAVPGEIVEDALNGFVLRGSFKFPIGSGTLLEWGHPTGKTINNIMDGVTGDTAWEDVEIPLGGLTAKIKYGDLERLSGPFSALGEAATQALAQQQRSIFVNNDASQESAIFINFAAEDIANIFMATTGNGPAGSIPEIAKQFADIMMSGDDAAMTDALVSSAELLANSKIGFDTGFASPLDWGPDSSSTRDDLGGLTSTVTGPNSRRVPGFKNDDNMIPFTQTLWRIGALLEARENGSIVAPEFNFGILSQKLISGDFGGLGIAGNALNWDVRAIAMGGFSVKHDTDTGNVYFVSPAGGSVVLRQGTEAYDALINQNGGNLDEALGSISQAEMDALNPAEVANLMNLGEQVADQIIGSDNTFEGVVDKFTAVVDAMGPIQGAFQFGEDIGLLTPETTAAWNVAGAFAQLGAPQATAASIIGALGVTVNSMGEASEERRGAEEFSREILPVLGLTEESVSNWSETDQQALFEILNGPRTRAERRMSRSEALGRRIEQALVMVEQSGDGKLIPSIGETGVFGDRTLFGISAETPPSVADLAQIWPELSLRAVNNMVRDLGGDPFTFLSEAMRLGETGLTDFDFDATNDPDAVKLGARYIWHNDAPEFVAARVILDAVYKDGDNYTAPFGVNIPDSFRNTKQLGRYMDQLQVQDPWTYGPRLEQAVEKLITLGVQMPEGAGVFGVAFQSVYNERVAEIAEAGLELPHDPEYDGFADAVELQSSLPGDDTSVADFWSPSGDPTIVAVAGKGFAALPNASAVPLAPGGGSDDLLDGLLDQVLEPGSDSATLDQLLDGIPLSDRLGNSDTDLAALNERLGTNFSAGTDGQTWLDNVQSTDVAQNRGVDLADQLSRGGITNLTDILGVLDNGSDAAGVTVVADIGGEAVRVTPGGVRVYSDADGRAEFAIGSDQSGQDQYVSIFDDTGQITSTTSLEDAPEDVRDRLGLSGDAPQPEPALPPVEEPSTVPDIASTLDRLSNLGLSFATPSSTQPGLTLSSEVLNANIPSFNIDDLISGGAFSATTYTPTTNIPFQPVTSASDAPAAAASNDTFSLTALRQSQLDG